LQCSDKNHSDVRISQPTAVIGTVDAGLNREKSQLQPATVYMAVQKKKKRKLKAESEVSAL
jgi:hypothetical protein